MEEKMAMLDKPPLMWVCDVTASYKPEQLTAGKIFRPRLLLKTGTVLIASLLVSIVTLTTQIKCPKHRVIHSVLFF